MIPFVGGQGTRTIRHETPALEWGLRIKWALAFLVGCEGVVLVITLMGAALGSWTIPLLFATVATGASAAQAIMHKWDRGLAVLVCAALFVFSFAFFAGLRVELWDLVAGPDAWRELWHALWDPIARVSWGVWIALFVVWAWLSFRGLGRLWFSVVLVGVFVWCAYVWDHDARIVPAAVRVWARARWLVFLHLWPIIPALVLLMTVAVQEIFFPALTHTLTPIKYSEFKESGLLALWFPRLGKWIKERRERVQYFHFGAALGDGRQRRYKSVPPGDQSKGGLVGFLAGVLLGAASLSADGNEKQKGLTAYGYRQSTWRQQVRPALQGLGYIAEQGRGYVLTESGVNWAANLIAAEKGTSAVPEEYRILITDGYFEKGDQHGS